MIYSSKFNNETWPNFLWQPTFAIIFLCVVLFFMNRYTTSDLLWAVGAGALASSCFIVFGKPSSAPANPFKIIGGYTMGILIGVIFHSIALHLHDLPAGFLGTTHFHIVGMIAAICTGVCLLLMSLLRVEHPPAAGMSLVLVIDLRDYYVVLIVFIAAIILAGIRRLLCHRLIDLA